MMALQNKLSAIIVDDHTLYREGIRSVIQKMTNSPIKIVDEAGSGAEFFLHLSEEALPDLVLLDIILPDMSGVEIARRLKTEYPQIKIIMLSSEVSEELISEVIEIGVEGYLSKLANKEDLEAAITTVIGGSQFIGRNVAKMMYDIYLNRQHQHSQSATKKTWFGKSSKEGHDAVFTEREKEIIRLLCDGLQIKEVADKLNISPRTVETHKSKILAKLGFSRLTDLIKYAIKEGLTVI